MDNLAHDRSCKTCTKRSIFRIYKGVAVVVVVISVSSSDILADLCSGH